MENVNHKFFHHLYDTLILLGAPPTVATMVRNPEVTTESDVDDLRIFNIGLIDSAKDRLANINKIRISPGD